MNKDDFISVCERLYNSEDYNRAIGVMAVTKDKPTYAKNLLTALKIEQSVAKDIQQK